MDQQKKRYFFFDSVKQKQNTGISFIPIIQQLEQTHFYQIILKLTLRVQIKQNNNVCRRYFRVDVDDCYEKRALQQSNKDIHLSNNQKSKKQRHSVKKFLQRLDEKHNSEDEGIQDYKIGGYHPVHIGQILIARYVVIQKLGWGHFSTVWLCKDFKHKTFVAIKIQKSSPHYMEAAFDEVEILQKVQTMCSSPKSEGKTREDTHVVGLLNAFVHKSIYGNHFCMVFQILRCNLLDAIKSYNYEGIPLDICQSISEQVLQGLDYLHRVCGVIHTDLKPQNVMLCLTNQQLKQIIEKGQLSNHQLFSERTKLFQQCMGILPIHNVASNQTITDGLIQQKLKDPNLTKNQRKNLKKKIRKQRQKEIQNNNQNARQQQQINQNSQRLPQINFDDLFDINKGKIQINRGHKLKLPLKVKIADLGNACWKHHQFSTQIQTRQYRSPQVILGQTYNQTSDMWSFACMMYELLTGDLLFQPKKSQNWSKNDDHLAQMQELLGPFDKNFIARSPKAKRYFNKNGTMKHFPQLNHYSLSTVLQLKNKIKQKQAIRFAQFLLPMLVPEQQKRMKASNALQQSWLSIKQFQNPCKMSQDQHGLLKELFYEDESKFRAHHSKLTQDEASCQDNCTAVDEEWRENRKKGYRFADIRFVDRSFTDLGYVGYCDGIDMDKLDRCRNWQFK